MKIKDIRRITISVQSDTELESFDMVNDKGILTKAINWLEKIGW